jgi:exopolysaccharide production protein ExoY
MDVVTNNTGLRFGASTSAPSTGGAEKRIASSSNLARVSHQPAPMTQPYFQLGLDPSGLSAPVVPAAAGPVTAKLAGPLTGSFLGSAIKRMMDIAISGITLIILAPLIVMIAGLISLQMGGDIFYSQPRVGRRGRLFDCYKFRSMVSDSETILAAFLAANPAAQAEWTATRKLQDDPRITPLGRLLRKSSLDELPQLFNVLIGDMSCVGPRPVVPTELEKYGTHSTDYLSVRPGLTGIWQVSGRSHLSYADRVRLDADYVQHWSLKRDIVILLKTIPAVAKFEEAA